MAGRPRGSRRHISHSGVRRARAPPSGSSCEWRGTVRAPRAPGRPGSYPCWALQGTRPPRLGLKHLSFRAIRAIQPAGRPQAKAVPDGQRNGGRIRRYLLHAPPSRAPPTFSSPSPWRFPIFPISPGTGWPWPMGVSTDGCTVGGYGAQASSNVSNPSTAWDRYVPIRRIADSGRLARASARSVRKQRAAHPSPGIVATQPEYRVCNQGM